MRTILKIFVTAAILSIAGTQQSCTKDKQEEIAYNIASSYINKGKWKVTRFAEDGKDETGTFREYIFQFNTDGTVTATKGNTSVKGTWSAGSDDSKSKMYINFGPSPLNELNEDWVIKNATAKTMQLEHTSGGDGGVDYLNLEKI
jgi:hypothetical protein